MATFLALLLLSFTTYYSMADVSWNIDCGSLMSSYTDDNTGMKWIGDSSLIKSGESRNVSSSSLFDHVLDTLRVFTTGKKNCYSLKAEKRAKVLMQLSFYYGNYDGKSLPPTFDLEIDGNYWDTVKTSGEGWYTYDELVYNVAGDSIKVCLVRTHDGQFPIISSIRIQSLPSGMYKGLDSNHALASIVRYAFGSNNSIGYPNDIYGREWDNIDFPVTEYTVITNDAASVDPSMGVEDYIPGAVMENAITTLSSSRIGSLILNPKGLSTSSNPVYIIMYFTEVSQLGSSEKRSFSVYVDDKLISKEVVSPTYGSATELSIPNLKVSNDTKISLFPTSDSTLPPIISAMEIYEVFEFTPLPSSSSKPNVVVLISGLLMFSFLINCLV